MTNFSPREKPADAAGEEYQWDGMVIRYGAWRDAVDDRRRRRVCVSGDCMTTDRHAVKDPGRWGLYDDGSPELVGRLPILHIGSSYGWAGGRLCFDLCCLDER